jgi:hypothetical protein
MTFISKIKEGISSVWPTSSPQKLADESEAAVMDRFRKAMLELLEGEMGEHAARLNLRIRCAASLQSLWFMRSDMMAVLAASHGEVEARHRLELISETVRDSLPSGLRSRPSPLSREP